MRITKNFTLKELCKSNTALSKGLKNEPDQLQINNLEDLVKHLLQPLRNTFGKITITSGFRSAEVNKAVGGVPTSLHAKGCAADCYFNEADLYRVYTYIITSELPYTECIYYTSKNFIHLALDLSSSKKLSTMKS